MRGEKMVNGINTWAREKEYGGFEVVKSNASEENDGN
jgi:hypothetical protein